MHPGIRKVFSVFFLFFAVWLALRLVLPLCAPFLLGTVLALAAEPLVNALHRLHVPRPIGTGIAVTMAFCLLAAVVLLLCAFLVRELTMLAGVLPDLEATAGAGMDMTRTFLLDLSEHTPQSIQPVLRENVDSLFSNGAALLNKLLKYLLGLAGNLLSHIPDSALGLGTAILSGYMICAKLPRIRKWLRRRIPRDKWKAMTAAAARMKKTLLSWLTAQCKLMGTTFVIVFLGLTLLRIPYALLWALGICLVDAFPILGTGTVLLPWAAVCLFQNDGARALGILGIYVSAALTRSMLEPRLLGRHLGLDPLVTLMTMYAGYRLWGVSGMIFAPLLAVTAIQLVPERGRGEMEN